MEYYEVFHNIEENEEVEKLVVEVFPRQMVELGQLLETERFNVTDLSVFHSDLRIPSPADINGSPPDNPPAKRKRTVSDTLNDTATPVGTKQAPLFKGYVPSNPKLVEIVDCLKPKIIDTMNRCNTIKVWIQLRIPKIEDGNNFGVSIQEDILAEVSKAEADSAKFMEQISRYFSVRAKLVSKAAKYPHLDDYRRGINEYDEKVFLSFKIMLMELRNIYAILYDVIIKNFEKIKQPRSSHANSLY
ncbi:proteasome activator complex subunit 3-like isoform X2 [Halichondria panicea]|uniref:proteasome activator complex subunit 3-like isoform X2 n=1 Tax=Halichondria panicea TaxID=6063 RepID=UPI00312B967A